MEPDLRDYDFILINTSAGKDSQAMMDYVVELADRDGVRDRLQAVHCDFGRVEWEGTCTLAIEQAAHYGIKCHVMQRRQGDLLTHVAKRGMWPSPKARYCTSDHKRAQVHRLITTFNVLDRKARVLNCMGFRRQESRARAKKPPFIPNVRPSNGKRQVDDWYPILDWTTEDVWARIHRSGVRHHRAYDLGMPRLSCVFCIMAPKAALVLAGKHNSELLDEYVEVELNIGHRFREELSMSDVRRSIDAGEDPGTIRTWSCS